MYRGKQGVGREQNQECFQGFDLNNWHRDRELRGGEDLYEKGGGKGEFGFDILVKFEIHIRNPGTNVESVSLKEAIKTGDINLGNMSK